MIGSGNNTKNRADRSSSIRLSRRERVGSLRFSTIVENLLTRALAKWLKQSGIVLLLPHGLILFTYMTTQLF